MLLGVAAVARILLRRPTFLDLGLGGLTPPWPLHLLALLMLFGLALALRARARGRAQVPWDRLILAAAFVLVLAFLPSSGAVLGADGQHHLEQLNQIWLQGRIDLHGGIEPGAAILWSPFFALAHAVALGAEAAGLDVTADGFSGPYRNALRLGSALYALLAAVLGSLVCRRYFPPVFSAGCVATVWLSSTLFHYSAVEPAMAHAPAAAVASLLLLLWLRARDEPGRPGRWAAVAAAGGLLVAIQRYDVYLLVPALLSALAFIAASWRTPSERPRVLASLGLAALAFGLALLPLVLVSFSGPDRFLLDPEVIAARMISDWRHPHVAELLFSSNGGFFSWTPVALLGVIGLTILARRDPAVGGSLLLTLGLGVVLLASNPVWWGGWSFGARRLTEAFAIIALGFAAFAEAALGRPRALAAGAVAVLVGANVLLSRQVSRGRVPAEDAVSFSQAVAGSARDLYAAVGHPPSWPANWIFAWRHGVRPDRFDELFGRIPRERWAVGPGSEDAGAVLGRGWKLGVDRPVALPCWAVSTETTLLLALSSPVDRRLRLRACAARHPLGRRQRIAASVNGHPVAGAELGPEGREWSLVVPARAWRGGLNEVRLQSEWTLSAREAFETSQPAHAAWRLQDLSLEPIEPRPAGRGPGRTLRSPGPPPG